MSRLLPRSLRASSWLWPQATIVLTQNTPRRPQNSLSAPLEPPRRITACHTGSIRAPSLMFSRQVQLPASTTWAGLRTTVARQWLRRKLRVSLHTSLDRRVVLPKVHARRSRSLVSTVLSRVCQMERQTCWLIKGRWLATQSVGQLYEVGESLLGVHW
jgi:hypothetical protein